MSEAVRPENRAGKEKTPRKVRAGFFKRLRKVFDEATVYRREGERVRRLLMQFEQRQRASQDREIGHG